MKNDLLIIMFFVLVLFLPLIVFLRVYRTTFSSMAKNKSSSQKKSPSASGDEAGAEQSRNQNTAGKESE
jgi:hypothetical protein